MRENTEKYLQTAADVIKEEADALLDLIPQLDEGFARACEIILNCSGKVVLVGIGKSGHIASKIAASLASTGTESFFVNAGEAAHGDLGMIGDNDVVIAISNSGEGAELKTIVPILRRREIPLISICGNPQSSLASYADVNLSAQVEREAGPLNLAPTSSTTAELVIGDALTVALAEARNFTKQDFAMSHPGGTLGRRYFVKCADVMHTGDRIPLIAAGATIEQAMFEMTKKGLGMVAVTNENKVLIGIFTDGDLRRALEKGHSIKEVVGSVMTKGGTTIEPSSLAADAVVLMQKKQISCLVVVDEHNVPLGAFNMQDLLRAGIL